MSSSCIGQSKKETRSRRKGEGQDDLLTQDEVAARLKVTVRTVIRLQHDGVLPVITLGKAVRFYWPAVISHLITNFTVTRQTLKVRAARAI